MKNGPVKNSFIERRNYSIRGRDNSNNSRSMILVLKDSPSLNLEINQKVMIFSHASQVFNKIRELDNITERDLLESLHFEKNKEMVFKAGQNSG